MRYAAMLRPGRAWMQGNTVDGQDRAVMLAHLQAMAQRYDEGSVLFGGPFKTGDGGIVLLEAANLGQARGILDEDPAVNAGIMDYTLFEVRVFFDAISGHAWAPSS